MDKEKRITTIVLDKEADRKSMIIAEFTGKTLSAIYRDALDMYFSHFVNNDLLPAVARWASKITRYNLRIGDQVYRLIREKEFRKAGMSIVETILQLPEVPDAQDLITEGIRLVSVLSKIANQRGKETR